MLKQDFAGRVLAFQGRLRSLQFSNFNITRQAIQNGTNVAWIYSVVSVLCEQKSKKRTQKPQILGWGPDHKRDEPIVGLIVKKQTNAEVHDDRKHDW